MLENTESQEMYLTTIYALQKKNGMVRSVDVADERGYIKVSVHNAMKRLEEFGYVTLNMSSLNLVRTYILALENSGRIERTRLGNIDMLPKLKPSGVAITPIVGSIACGQPVDAVEQIEESVTLPRAIFGGGDLFILHTHGDSMIDIGIKHGDLVVIRKQNTAENGDIIVAMMNGETTLKRFYKRNGKVVLHPENKEMKDIIVKDCEIQGVLVSCIHIYN